MHNPYGMQQPLLQPVPGTVVYQQPGAPVVYQQPAAPQPQQIAMQGGIMAIAQPRQQVYAQTGLLQAPAGSAWAGVAAAAPQQLQPQQQVYAAQPQPLLQPQYQLQQPQQQQHYAQPQHQQMQQPLSMLPLQQPPPPAGPKPASAYDPPPPPRPMKRQAYQLPPGPPQKRLQRPRDAPAPWQTTTSRQYRSAVRDGTTTGPVGASSIPALGGSPGGGSSSSIPALGGDSQAADGQAAGPAANGDSSNGPSQASPGAAAAAAGPAIVPAAASRPFPGVVRMLHDVQELMFVVMQYVVKHHRPAVLGHHGRHDSGGYELCKFKSDFLDKYR